MVTIRSSTARMRAMTSNMRTARSLSTRVLALRVLGRGLAMFLLPSDMVAILGERRTHGQHKAASTVVDAAFACWLRLAAGELLAESGEGLVRGQGAGR